MLTARAQVQAVQSAQAQDDTAIQTIPTAVAAAVNTVKPKTDGLYFKGVKITPGGFIELANVYREHNTANDVSTALNTIPFPQSRQGHLEEDRFTPPPKPRLGAGRRKAHLRHHAQHVRRVRLPRRCADRQLQ